MAGVRPHGMPKWPDFLPGPLRTKLFAAMHRYFLRRGYFPFDTASHYGEDGLFTTHNDAFRRERRFREAYARGVEASEGFDPHIEWRVHVALWAAATALQFPGDFVECGVNAGFLSSAIMRHLDWARVPRRYYLIDTFSGPVLEQFSDAEVRIGRAAAAREHLDAGDYVTDLERVRANFREWPNALVVQGIVPEVLARIDSPSVAFLHLDMNCALPERAALEHFWSRFADGAVVLLDDYAHPDYRCQKDAIDEAARALGGAVLTLPTGQGIMVARRGAGEG